MTNPFNLCTKIRKIFRSAFGKYLLITNTISSGILMGAGDAIEQGIESKYSNKQNEFDWTRTRHMTCVGFIMGFPQHFFYGIMDAYIPGNKPRTVFKKILLDQCIASPASITLFFCALSYFESGSIKPGADELKKKFKTVYMVDWCFWPPTQFINFFYLSPKYRVIYVNAMTVLYDVFLSYIKYSHNPT